MFRKRSKIIALSLLVGFSPLSDYMTNSNFKSENPSRIENICGFHNEEIELIKNTLDIFNSKYSFDINPYFLKANTNFPSDVGGMAFFNLGHDAKSNCNFTNLFNNGEYGLLDGQDVIVMNSLDKYKIWSKKDDSLFDSIYLPNSNPHIFYKRAVLHELGHLLFHRLSDSKLINQISNIDIVSKSYTMGSSISHPAHPSFYTFFLACAPDFPDDLIKCSVNEQFADIFSLNTLGYLNNKIDDGNLIKKIDLVNEKLSPYEL